MWEAILGLLLPVLRAFGLRQQISNDIQAELSELRVRVVFAAYDLGQRFSSDFGTETLRWMREHLSAYGGYAHDLSGTIAAIDGLLATQGERAGALTQLHAQLTLSDALSLPDLAAPLLESHLRDISKLGPEYRDRAHAILTKLGHVNHGIADARRYLDQTSAPLSDANLAIAHQNLDRTYARLFRECGLLADHIARLLEDGIVPLHERERGP